MKSFCLVFIFARVLISVVHCQWSDYYRGGELGGNYYGGYGLGGGIICGGYDRWNLGLDRFCGGGLLGLGCGALSRREYY